MPESITSNASPYIAHGLLAIFGAIVHASKAHRDGKSKTFIDFFLLIIMASFTGVMFSIIGSEMFGRDSYMALAMTGIGGFLGVEGMTYVVNYLVDKFKK